MFCPNCAQELAPQAATCTSCGASVAYVGPGTSAAQQLGRQFAAEARLASTTAWSSLRILATHPVEGFPTAIAAAGSPARAGIALAVFADLCIVIALYRLTSAAAGWMPFVGPGNTFTLLLKLVVVGAVPFFGLAGAGALARKILRGSGSWEGDLFTAGVVLAPGALWMLLAGLLGGANLEVTGLLAGFAASYMILLQFGGCRGISKISEPATALATPTILILAGWVSKVLVGAWL